MKLRSIVSVGVMALAAAAFADYTDGKVVGWARVESPNARTIIGVPWLNVGGDGNVEVAKLVKTDTLTQGDKLYVFDNGTWYFYELDSSKAWVAGNTVNANASPVAAGDPTTATIARGKALVLERASTSDPFYLYGKYGDLDSAELTATVAAMSGTKPTLTLLASPKLAEIDVNANNFITGTINASDSIIMPVEGGFTTSYTRNADNTAWVKKTTTTMTRFGKTITVEQLTSEGCTIPLGTGFWYSRAGDSALTINW